MLQLLRAESTSEGHGPPAKSTAINVRSYSARLWGEPETKHKKRGKVQLIDLPQLVTVDKVGTSHLIGTISWECLLA